MSPAIVPFSGDIPDQARFIQIDQNAAYPDSGVRYAGSYKSNIGQDGKWQLRPQKQFFVQLQRNTSSGLVTTTPTFIDSISLSYNALSGGSLDSLDLADGSNTANALRFSIEVPASGTDLKAGFWRFPTPLQFRSGLFYANGTTHSGGSIFFRLWGWTE